MAEQGGWGRCHLEAGMAEVVSATLKALLSFLLYRYFLLKPIITMVVGKFGNGESNFSLLFVGERFFAPLTCKNYKNTSRDIQA